MSKVSTIIREQILSQYAESDFLINFFEALASEGDTLSDAIDDTNQFRTLEFAQKVNLDVLGKLVGQGREVVDTNIQIFFGFSPDPLALSFTDLNDLSLGGRYRDANEPETTTRELTDTEYRSVIAAAIQRNISKCTPNEIIQSVKFVLALIGGGVVPRVQLIDGNTYYGVYIGRLLSIQEEAFLAGLNLLPKPAGVSVDYIEYNEANYFGFFADTQAKGFGSFTSLPLPLGAYQTQIRSDGPIMYMPLNDAAGSLIAVNDFNVDGNMAGAYTFGVTGLISTGEGSALDLTSQVGGIDLTQVNPLVIGSFSLEMWIQTDVLAAVDQALFANNGMGLFINNNTLVWKDVTDVIDTNVLVANTIYHIVFAVDDLGNGKFYVNTIPGVVVLNVTSLQAKSIGYDIIAGDVDYFSGVIDQAAIYNYTLSFTTIQQHFLLGTPLSVYQATIEADIPLAYMRLAEVFGSVAVNSIDPANNGTYAGSLTQGVPGLIDSDTNRALQVDDIAFSGVTLLNPVPIPGDWSLECWIVPAVLTAGKNQPLIMDSLGLGGMTLKDDRLNYINLGLDASTLQQLTVGQKYHVVVTFTLTGPGINGTLNFYIDGVLSIGTVSHGGIIDAQLVGYGSNSDQYDGIIDEPAIYNYELTPAQVLSHYNDALGVLSYSALILSDSPFAYWRLGDSIGSSVIIDEIGVAGVDCTVFNNPILGSSPLISSSDNNSIDFVSPSRLQNCGVISDFNFIHNGSDFTIEFWFNLDAITTIYNMIGTAKALTELGWEILYIKIGGPPGFLRFAILDGGGGGTFTIILDSPSNPVIAGDTYYLAVTGDGATARMYLNGIQIASGPFGLFTSGNPEEILQIGNVDSNINPMQGPLDEVAIYNTVLTPAQILAHYNKGIGV